MAISKKSFSKELKDLKDRYLKHRDQYEANTYNETDVRNEFLNKMFKALGWDVENVKGNSPSERDVWMERGDCQGKRPDYNFRIAGKTAFYLEAKAPHVNVETAEFAYQAKSYSWSTTETVVSLSILSNFKEIVVYDTTMVPDFEYPDRGRLFRFSVEEFSDAGTIEKLWLLSREEMEKGSLLNLLKKDRSREVFRVRPDKRLLELLNKLRVEMANSIFRLNKDLSLEEIEDTVGTLVNRFLFIRVLEDRGTIDRREMKDLVDDWEDHQDSKGALLIKAIREEFNYINENFNGKLFDGDPLENIKIDPNVLAASIRSLYGRKCPFAFNRLDTNTLGHIYEKFLSSQLSKSSGRIKLEEKEIIRKTGGVFYTPKEIVEFMCEDSLTAILEKQKDVSKVVVLDPSCGSGTFLLTAYKMLLDKAASKRNLDRSELEFSEKRKILLSSIFGIDVDGEASKVAILSLCLLALENEPHISKGKRLLPNLKNNLIKSDSLITKKIEGRNPVNLESFPPRGEKFVILGNPPYLNVKRDFFSEDYKAHLESKYQTAVGHWDTYGLFLERCKQWKADVFSMIVPKPILTNENQAAIRNVIAPSLTRITDAGMAFDDASVEAVVLQCGAQKSDLIQTFKWDGTATTAIGGVNKSAILDGSAINIYSDPTIVKSFDTIEKNAIRLQAALETDIMRGIEKGKNALVESSGKNRYKCFAGAEVNSLQAGKPNKYIEVVWSKAGAFKTQSLYIGPKVLVRRVTNSLISSVDYSDSVCLNTLYILRSAEPFDSETLAIYVASAPIQFWFKYKYVNDDVLFPYIRKNQLDDIPLPKDIEKLCKNLRSTAQKMVGSDGADLVAKKKADLVICEAFGLSEKELEKMHAYLIRVTAAS